MQCKHADSRNLDLSTLATMAAQTSSDGVPLKKDGNPYVCALSAVNHYTDLRHDVVHSDMRFKAARDATGS